MKIGVIADIHSNGLALERILDHLFDQEIRDIYCAGDLVGYNTQPNEVINLIKRHSINCVLGNHDVGLLHETPENFNYIARRSLDWNRREISEENRIYLQSFRKELWENFNGTELHMVHGSPDNPIGGYLYEEDIDEEYLAFCYDEPPNILIHGQTHRGYEKRVGDTLVVNPGSVGQPRDGDNRASCAIIDIQEMRASIHRIKYNVSELQTEIRENLPIELANRLEAGK